MAQRIRDTKPKRPKVQELYARKSEEAQLENLQNEVDEWKRKCRQLEEEIINLRGIMKTKDKIISDEIVQKRQLSKQIDELTEQQKKYHEESSRGCVPPCTHQRCLKARAKFLLQKGEQETAMLEEKLRQRAATKEDIEDVLKSFYVSQRQDQDKLHRNLLTQFQAFMNGESASREKETRERERELQQEMWKKQYEKLKEENSHLTEKILHFREKAHEKYKNMEEELTSARTTITHHQQELEKSRDYIHQLDTGTQCRRRGCEIMAQNVADLEIEVENLKGQLSKRSASHSMPQLREDLGTACENLLTNYDILKCIENHFENSFDAKGFISNVFLDAYEKCKQCLYVHVCKNIDELFEIQTDETRVEELECLSHAFGLLLQASGIALKINALQAIEKVQQEVKDDIPNLEFLKRATCEAHDIADTLPIKPFVELAWNFVTQAYPVIVREPETSTFDAEIHKESFQHWSEERDGQRSLIYAQPVVYRSFHGEVMRKGLVGN